MTVKNIVLSTIVSLLVLPGIAQTKKIALSGTIKGLAGREVAIFGNGDFKTPMTKVNSTGDTFKLDVEVAEDGSIPYYLNIPAIGGFGPSMKIPSFMLFLDASNLVVDASITDDRISLNSVKGSAMMDEYKRIDSENKYNALIAEASKAYNNAFEVYNTKNEQNEITKARLTETSDALSTLYGQKGDEFVHMISKYPKSKALAFYISSYFNGATLDKKKELIGKFDASIHTSYPLAKLAESVRLEEGTAIGKPLPDFNTYTVDGKLDKLTNYRGQYLLIDFWASWCGPCIKEIPNLKSVYNDYKDKGLKLVGISVDQDQDKWKKAIEQHGLDNLQLHDTDNVTGKLLNYQGIPFIILVSPEGVILERDIRGEKIREKVKQYLD